MFRRCGGRRYVVSHGDSYSNRVGNESSSDCIFSFNVRLAKVISESDFNHKLNFCNLILLLSVLTFMRSTVDFLWNQSLRLFFDKEKADMGIEIGSKLLGNQKLI